MFVRFCQKIVRRLSKFLLGIFLDIQVKSQGDLSKIKGPLIMAANHTVHFDPFIIGAAFPDNSLVFPIHFACYYKYYYFPLFYPILKLTGAFSVRRGVGMRRVLRRGVEVLKKGGVVGIFPEGHRNRLRRPAEPDNGQTKGKRGAAYLSIKTKAPILPILIKGTLEINLLKILFTGKRAKIIVKIGQTFYPQSQDISDLDPATIEIIQKIRGLG